MKRSGLGGERICFIFDESNALSSAFLEKMNALLASGEVRQPIHRHIYHS